MDLEVEKDLDLDINLISPLGFSFDLAFEPCTPSPRRCHRAVCQLSTGSEQTNAHRQFE